MRARPASAAAFQLADLAPVACVPWLCCCCGVGLRGMVATAWVAARAAAVWMRAGLGHYEFLQMDSSEEPPSADPQMLAPRNLECYCKFVKEKIQVAPASAFNNLKTKGNMTAPSAEESAALLEQAPTPAAAAPAVAAVDTAAAAPAAGDAVDAAAPTLGSDMRFGEAAARLESAAPAPRTAATSRTAALLRELEEEDPDVLAQVAEVAEALAARRTARRRSRARLAARSGLPSELAADAAGSTPLPGALLQEQDALAEEADAAELSEVEDAQYAAARREARRRAFAFRRARLVDDAEYDYDGDAPSVRRQRYRGVPGMEEGV